MVFLARRSPENIWRDQMSKREYSAIHLLTNEEQTTVLNRLFGISGIPHHAVFDQAGTLVQAKVGRAGPRAGGSGGWVIGAVGPKINP